MESSEITKLALLLRQHGDKILNGNHQLALTATLLQYLNNAFCMVVEHDENSSFQVIHTTNSKLHDLHFLHDFIQKVEGLIISHGASTLKGNVDISKFRNLRYLELRRVPLHMVTGLPLIQHHLKCVLASQSLSRPSDLLGGEGEPLPANAWPELWRLSLAQNTLSTLDSSLKLATSLKEVDLSHNQLCDVPELVFLSNLTVLNLSYNRLQVVPLFHHQSSRTLKALAMAHNQLESLSGLEVLSSLQILHAGWNCLLDSSSLTPLSRLSSLRQLWLDGNPMSRHAHYREQTAKHLHPCVSSVSQFKLNGTVLNEQEKRWVGAACLGLSASLVATNRETGAQKLQQGGSRSETRRGVKVREAVIADLEESTTSAIDISFSSENFQSLDTSTEHLETKRQIESLREKLGDNWLVSVPGALGLPESTETVASSSYQCHEAQAWLDSQQRPPQVTSNHSPNTALLQDSTSIEGATDQASIDNVVTIHSETNVEHSDTENASFDIENTSSDFETSNQSEPIVESQDEQDEEDEEGSEPPFLVQRKLSDTVSRDYFFIVGPSMLVEREVAGKGKIVTQWTMDSLQSCEHPTLCQVTLTFDTIRRDKQRREYTLEASEVQRLCSCLGSRLESRSLRDMNQVAFHCMKCSAKFSAEITVALATDTPARCPSCSSAVVVQDDPEWASATQPPRQQQLIHSDSQSSIGASCIPTASKVLVAAEVHPCVAAAAAAVLNNVPHTPSKKSSAASLDQSMSDSGLGLTGGRSRFTEGADSDIEVLSNPSQSSIEILPNTDDNHSREQSVAPASNLSEASVLQAKSPHGLTESSSSGSMTDSVCTAYESGNPNATTSQPSSSLSGVVGSFFQRFVSLSSSPTGKEANQPVLYNFSDFARIDHRLKLYLCMHVLNHENELLTALLRCWVLPSSTANGIPFSGLLIISSQALYIMKIQGSEGDNPEQWLVNEGVWPLSQVLNICVRLWHHAVEVTIQCSNSKIQNYTLILGDTRHATGFLSFITGLVPATCQVQHLDTGDHVDEPLPMIGPEQTVFFAILSNFLPSDKTGGQQAYGPIALAVSNAEVALSKEDLRFVPQQDWSEFWAFHQPITSLMEMEKSSSAPWMLRLHFTEESGDSSQNQSNDKTDSQGFVDEEWTLWFVSQQSRLGVIEALRSPWQKFFEVPLDVRLV